jgi:asparagine synthase (glutamine-hydrolysing)
MCGIAGIFNVDFGPEDISAVLRQMADSMVHRGPDDCGIFVSSELRAGLACRRLSIVDLTSGSQPICSEDGAIAVVMNGEIYNHRELRAALERRGHRFRSRADTEVVVHLYEDHGIDCLARLNGMFAIAILDGRARKLVLARDPCGMKPLYWTRTAAGFLFASEVKALLASGLMPAEPDWAAVDTYLATGFVPAPQSCFKGIQKLPPGGYAVVESGHLTQNKFWRLRFENGAAPRTDSDYAADLEERLRAAVRTHLDADVTVGALVSGGLDSSLIATFAAQSISRPLKTFSLVFPDDPDIDESRFSRLLTANLGTEHQEIEFRAADVPSILQKAVRSLEEPCTASPALLDFRLFSEVSRAVKTVVGGEGSDELFAGYGWLRSNIYHQLRRVVPTLLPRMLQPIMSDPRLVRACAVLSAADDASADPEWFRAFTPKQMDRLLRPDIRAARPDVSPLRVEAETLSSCSDPLQRRLAFAFSRRMSDGILLVHDKISMAHSLELRLPFLDRAVVDFALALPSHMKLRQGREKFVLSLLARHIPPEITRRRKFGLQYPERCLLSGPVRSFATEMLLDSSRPGGLFERRVLEPLLMRALSRPGERVRLVWMLLFLQVWWKEFFDG